MKQFFKDALSESGDISFGRFASLVILANVLLWDIAYIAFAMHRLDFSHMTVGDVLPSNAALTAQAAFSIAFYTINKVQAAVNLAQTTKCTDPTHPGA